MGGTGREVRRSWAGGRASEKQVEAAVVGSQRGRQGAEVGNFGQRQPVQPEPKEVVGFLGSVNEFLQFVQDMTVEEVEQ